MKKSILGAIGTAVIATIFCVGCGSEEGELIVTVNKEQQVAYYTLTVEADSAGGTVSRNPDESRYISGDTVTVTAEPNPGYRFAGWEANSKNKFPAWANASKDTTGILKVKVYGNDTLTANFEPIPYALTILVIPESLGIVSREPNKRTYIYGDEVTVTAAAKPGYTFYGWRYASQKDTAAIISKDTAVTITITGNDTLIASFRPLYNLMTRWEEAGGSVTSVPNATVFMDGDMVTLKAEPNVGFAFAGWFNALGVLVDGAAEVTVKMDRDVALFARFVPIMHTLETIANPAEGGKVSQTPNSPEGYAFNQEVIITAEANPGYKFTGWSDGVEEPSLTINIAGNTVRTANFEQLKYKLELVAYPGGGGVFSREPDKADYTYGEEVTVTVEPKSGYAFTGWSGAAESADLSVTIIITGNATLRANFTPTTYVPGQIAQRAIEEKLVWLKENANSGGYYVLEINADDTLNPLEDYGKLGAFNVTVTLKGVGANRTVTLLDRVIDTTTRDTTFDTDGTTVLDVEITTDTVICTGPMFTVSPTVTFILDNITLKGHDVNKNALVAVESGGVLKMNAGSRITGNFNNTDHDLTYPGSGVYVGPWATFEMSGGTIDGNRTSSGGGGVFVHSSGTFKMSGGTISDNSADIGGGVYAHGTFTMSGGNITGNSAATYGGGVYAVGTFEKNGGEITGGGSGGNTAGKASGGNAVYVTETRYRQSTAGSGVKLHSGAAAGWDDNI